MLSSVRRYLELIRFSHTVFALPFALLSAALASADTRFQPITLIGILICMVTARSAAMAFNRLVDRRFDAANPRTATRHLPAGTLTVPAVSTFTLLSSLTFVASTALFLLADPPNPWPLWLAGPVLGVVLGYSLTKRFTRFAHFWLGLALALAPVAAWVAVRGVEDLTVPGILAVAVFFWVAGFDMLYSAQDADFDRTAGLHSLPARLGIRRALRVAAFCHALTFLALVGFGLASPRLGSIYFVGLIPIGVLLIWQHRLVSPTDLSRVNAAFFQVNAIISFGLLGLVLLQLTLG